MLIERQVAIPNPSKTIAGNELAILANRFRAGSNAKAIGFKHLGQMVGMLSTNYAVKIAIYRANPNSLRISSKMVHA